MLGIGIGPRPDRLAGSRLVLALALLGAVLGFLPFNFNPAVIFLGDAGSLLLGYVCAVLILSLGEEGQTHYVIAGLIIFALPIMDTVLAILRRKLAGVPMSVADRNHIHHILLRSFGSVKKAVLVLYAINVDLRASRRGARGRGRIRFGSISLGLRRRDDLLRSGWRRRTQGWAPTPLDDADDGGSRPRVGRRAYGRSGEDGDPSRCRLIAGCGVTEGLIVIQ